MKYFLDTEFHEGIRRPLFGRPHHFLELISIGIVAEDGREYYAISSEFNVNRAWNSYDIEPDFGKPQGLGDKKYWLRENVLKPIHAELIKNHYWYNEPDSLESLIKIHGKPHAVIAREILQFMYDPDARWLRDWDGLLDGYYRMLFNCTSQPVEFYGYFADYDWVALCSVFGRMIDLPKGFPFWCRDLKQMMWERGLTTDWKRSVCPDPVDEHNALADARWNKRLHHLITTTKPVL